MVNCDYCDKELDRKVFCNTSHKVMYHRHGKKKIFSFESEIIKMPEPVGTTTPKELYTYEWLMENFKNWNDLCPNHGVKIFDCAFIKHPKKENTGSLEKIYNTS